MAKEAKDTDHYFSPNPKSKPKCGLIRTHLRGRPFEFLTASGVFSKKRVDSGSRLLIESMLLPEKGRVLDMGCGYGAVGIAAAASNPTLHVVLVDANARAVWLARQNVERNLVSNVEVRRGCLYAPVSNMTFNCVLSNPPVSAGLDTVKRIIVEAPTRLEREGTFQMVVRSKIGGERLRMIFEEAFENVEIIARGGGYRVFLSRIC